MEFHGDNDIEMWDWREEDFSLQKDSELGVPHCLWNDMNQNDNSFLYTWGEHTPIKDCGNFGYDLHVGDKTNKVVEESRGSQFKRRRMLQFTPDANDTHIGNGQISFVSENSKELENSLLSDEILECLEWNPEWNSSFSDDKGTFDNERGFDQGTFDNEGGFDQGTFDNEGVFDQSSEGWLANCFTETEMHHSSGETSSCMNDSVTSDDRVEFSESVKTPSEVESAQTRDKPGPSICRIFRGKKSFMNTPTKLTTAVAYPFTLIKPFEDQGDVTLKDINQRIHAPPASRSKIKKDEGPYPTSAFSGKPVVAKTKIRTEGGKGSITIMRTRG